MPRILFPTLFASAVLACGMPFWGQPAFPPASPKLSNEPALPGDTSEYAAMRWAIDWLRQRLRHRARSALVRDTTNAVMLPVVAVLLATDTTVLEQGELARARRTRLAGLDTSLLQDFFERNSRPMRLDADSLTVPVILVGDSIKHMEWWRSLKRPDTELVVLVLSRPGFGDDYTHALISWSLCAPGVCDQGGYLLLARAPGRRWTLWAHWRGTA